MPGLTSVVARWCSCHSPAWPPPIPGVVREPTKPGSTGGEREGLVSLGLGSGAVAWVPGRAGAVGVGRLFCVPFIYSWMDREGGTQIGTGCGVWTAV